MSIGSWNIRGLNHPDKILEVRNLISRLHVDCIGLTETKFSNTALTDVSNIWGFDNFNYVASNSSINHSGGLLLIWCSDFFKCEAQTVTDIWIILKGRLLNHDWPCVFGLIYGSCIDADREDMFSDLTAYNSQLHCPLLIFGDFNEVLYIENRRGQQRLTSSIKVFGDWVHSNFLIDIPLNGTKYTWGRGKSRSRLDDWISQFPNLSLKALPKNSSDHNALLLSLHSEENWGPKPFRNLNTWFTHPSFKKLIDVE